MDGIKEVLSQVWAKIDLLLAVIESKGAKVLATAAEIRKAQRAIKEIWRESSAETKAQGKSGQGSEHRAATDPDVRSGAESAGDA